VVTLVLRAAGGVVHDFLLFTYRKRLALWPTAMQSELLNSQVVAWWYMRTDKTIIIVTIAGIWRWKQGDVKFIQHGRSLATLNSFELLSSVTEICSILEHLAAPGPLNESMESAAPSALLHPLMTTPKPMRYEN
jgi:hypothetical protein